METYAVMRACQRFGLPLIALRGISDGDRELGTLADWTQYLGIIDVKLGRGGRPARSRGSRRARWTGWS